MNIPSEELEICLKVLQQISENPAVINDCDRIKSLIAKIHKEGKKGSRRNERERQKAEDITLKASTVMVQKQRHQTSPALLPESSLKTEKKLNKPNSCYICKQPYAEVHFFYHLLCPSCAELNYQKRHQRTNLTGRVALVTGGRIKIGYQTALRMLQDGAKVIVTTRFPRDCARRFSSEPDFDRWASRLQIHGLDLRDIPAVEAFVEYIFNSGSSIDIIINNAAQTIKRPLGFYQHLLEGEREALEALPAPAQRLIKYGSARDRFLLEDRLNYSGNLPALTSAYFPPNIFDADGQQLDLRPINSWLQKLDEVSTSEMLEVQLVNAIAPFILNSKLKPLLLRSPFERRFIINVSAMEGQFNRENKTVFHPHTNMAKAGLNMMTRTSAADYASNGIFMNSVDTGWITDENPYPKKTRLQETRNFYPPLDAIDGMARIYDPIVQGIENSTLPLYGHFLKDYVPYPW